ncbi:MAG: thioredoxin domain-containing protein [Thermoplasmata archaeon]
MVDMDKNNRNPNTLSSELSAFLKEASNSPVNWYTWSEKPFELAKKQNKVILIDDGACWCHWCHVMDKESYDNEDIANYINDHFIPIKIDVDEMPDLDKKLQLAVSSITGESGWPLTVFMTPTRKVFFGGTYFPPVDIHGKPAFKRVLEKVIEIWQKEGDNIEGLSLSTFREEIISIKDNPIKGDLIDDSTSSILEHYDWKYGGLQENMKFPRPMIDKFLLSSWFYTGNANALKASIYTLKSMYMGGIMDQIGGGFHRYTIDNQWWIPHFEKLLIDNAEILSTFLDAYLITHDDELLDAIKLSYNFIKRDLWLGNKFANSLDSDSEGVEGKYYTWTKEEIKSFFRKDFEVVFSLYSINHEYGWVNNRKVLKRAFSNRELKEKVNTDPYMILNGIRNILFAHRNIREPPYRDNNAYSYSNYIALEAMLKTGFVIDADISEFIDFASKIPAKISRRVDGSGEGILEDWISAIFASIAYYEITGDYKVIDKIKDFGKIVMDMYLDPSYIFDSTHEALVSMYLRSMIYLHELFPEEFDIKEMDKIIKTSLPSEYKIASSLISSLIRHVSVIQHGIIHIIITGEDEKAKSLHRTALSLYSPLKIVEKAHEGINSTVDSMIKNSEHSSAFVCVGNVCSKPIVDEIKLRELILNQKKAL